MKNRRNFLRGMTSLSLAPALLSFRSIEPKESFPISCNSYTWFTFYKRQGKVWLQDKDASLTDFTQSGIEALEPSLNSVDEARMIINLLKRHKIKMPSVYVNSVLHKADTAQQSIELVLAIADEVKKYGTKIVVTNPSPIEWGGTALKSDAELIEEARNIERRGQALKKKGLTLAYHTHDTELLAGAREFHHILQNTSPENVGFCMDVHWVYRGSKNSQVAVFDVLKMYGNRIVELHLRQSADGVWKETFGEGDIDYRRLANELVKMKIRPHLVIEQCIEDHTPNTLDAVQAHKHDLLEVMDVFKGLL